MYIVTEFCWLARSYSGCDICTLCIHSEPWQQESNGEGDGFLLVVIVTIRSNCGFCTCITTTRSESLYMAIGLQAGEEDVEEPESKEEQWSENLGNPWTPKFTSYGLPSAEHQYSHTKEGKNGEECDWEGQRTRVNIEDLSFHLPVHCSHGPGHTYTQKHIHCVASRHISYTCICILVLSCSHFTGKCV